MMRQGASEDKAWGSKRRGRGPLRPLFLPEREREGERERERERGRESVCECVSLCERERE